MNLELTGKLKAKSGVQMVGQNNDFAILKFWIDINENGNENTVEFQLAGSDKVMQITDLPDGTLIKVNFSIRGKKVTKDDKSYFFQNLNAFRITKITEEIMGLPANIPASNADEDLPF
jgi:hypothetical protein